MMQVDYVLGGIKNNFQLKSTVVDLRGRKRSSGKVVLSVSELEARRSKARAVSASKHGLEAICGASCETGAQ